MTGMIVREMTLHRSFTRIRTTPRPLNARRSPPAASNSNGVQPATESSSENRTWRTNNIIGTLKGSTHSGGPIGARQNAPTKGVSTGSMRDMGR